MTDIKCSTAKEVKKFYESRPKQENPEAGKPSLAIRGRPMPQ